MDGAIRDSETAEGIDLLRADLSHEEFTCASCFLVRHHSQLAYQTGGTSCCTDCEG